MELLLLFVFIIIVIPVIAIVVGIVFWVRMLSNKKVKTSSNTASNAANNGPPILPSQISERTSGSGLMRIRFDSTKTGIMTAGREQDMLESSERAANEWINKNSELEVVSITSTLGQMNASATIWYKKSANQKLHRSEGSRLQIRDMG